MMSARVCELSLSVGMMKIFSSRTSPRAVAGTGQPMSRCRLGSPDLLGGKPPPVVDDQWFNVAIARAICLAGVCELSLSVGMMKIFSSRTSPRAVASTGQPMSRCRLGSLDLLGGKPPPVVDDQCFNVAVARAICPAWVCEDRPHAGEMPIFSCEAPDA